MKLEINNFAKIKHADIIVDGITVIAGENNTGKSTVGKILFSLFNAVSGIEEKIIRQKVREVHMAITVAVMANDFSKTLEERRKKDCEVIAIEREVEKIIEENSTSKVELSEIQNIVAKVAQGFDDDNLFISSSDVASRLTEKLNEIINLPHQIIVQEIVSRYFSKVFYNQIDSRIEEDEEPEVRVEIKGNPVELLFRNDRCVDFRSKVSIEHNAVYIDNPFIIDDLLSSRRFYYDDNPIRAKLQELLFNQKQENMMDGIVGDMIAKEKLADIFQVLQTVVDGTIIPNQHDELYFEKEGFNEPILLSNLSAGLKSFVIIKRLLENGGIKEKDVLILDEPEIHLHPQWQIVYAELIVLLQKQFDLSVVVTTHSPYFLDAINLFTIKYGTVAHTNYYLSSMENNVVEMEWVNNNLEKIYQNGIPNRYIGDTTL